MKKYQGLIAAGFTPMRADGEVALEKVTELVDFAVNRKISALFINGTTGEFSSLSLEERLQLAEAYLKAAAGRLPIIVHVGSASVRESAILARHAKDQGAAAVGALAPFYFRPGDLNALVKTLKTIADACAPLPFYYYHIPVLTGVNFRMRDLLPLVEETIPNFAGIKFTHEDLMDYQRCVDYNPERFQIMFGRDEALLAGLALGAEAAVGSTYNFMPKIYHEVIAAFNKGDLPKARRWQGMSQAAISLLPRYGFAAQKFMMKLAGVDVGPARQPVTALSPAQETEIREALIKMEALELFG